MREVIVDRQERSNINNKTDVRVCVERGKREKNETKSTIGSRWLMNM